MVYNRVDVCLMKTEEGNCYGIEIKKKYKSWKWI